MSPFFKKIYLRISLLCNTIGICIYGIKSQTKKQYLNSFSIKKVNTKYTKGQIFMMDLIFSFIVLLVALGIASLYYSNVSDDEGLYDFTQESINRLTTLSINSLNNEEIRKLFATGKITNIENSLAQQISIFYDEGELDLARNITRIFFENTEGQQFFMNISLINSSGSDVSLYASPRVRVSYEDSKTSYAMTREVIAFHNGSYIIGPYSYRIIIWQ